MLGDADNAAAHTPITWRRSGQRSAAGLSRQKKRTNGSSPAGNRAGRKCARPPQRRNAIDGYAAGLSPPARLFATRSPERTKSLTDDGAQSLTSVVCGLLVLVRLWS